MKVNRYQYKLKGWTEIKPIIPISQYGYADMRILVIEVYKGIPPIINE